MPSADRRLIDLSATDTVDSIVAQLKTQPRPLIILLGDYDASLDPTVKSLFSRAIVPAAMDSGVVIVDNGANFGCSAAVGQAARDEDHGPTLFGIAPSWRRSIRACIDTMIVPPYGRMVRPSEGVDPDLRVD